MVPHDSVKGTWYIKYFCWGLKANQSSQMEWEEAHPYGGLWAV